MAKVSTGRDASQQHLLPVPLPTAAIRPRGDTCALEEAGLLSALKPTCQQAIKSSEDRPQTKNF